MTKQCPKCKTNKQHSQFDKCKSRYDGLAGYCKPCKKIDRQNSVTQRITKANYQRTSPKPLDWQLKNLYGISLEQYNTKLTNQNNCCAICNKPESIINPKTKILRRLAVDHSHSTGKIRDLLCSKCNHTIGLVSESIDILNNAIAYLKKHS